MATLCPQKDLLRGLGQRRLSLKKRRDMLLQQRGNRLFQGLYHCLCQCFFFQYDAVMVFSTY